VKRLNWTSIAIIAGLPALLAIIAWLIYILSAPDKWCGVQVAGGKIAGRPIADCTSIVLQLIHWLGWSTIALIACVCVAFLTIVARDLKAVLDVTGLGGTHLKVGGDGAAAGAGAVADAAADRAAEIAEGAKP
jgi:hypothetical protein